MATIRLVLLNSRKNSMGQYPILIAVTQKREVRYIRTDFVVDDLFQFENGEVICRKDAKVMNQRLKYVLSEYQEKLDNIPNHHIYNCSQIKEMLENKHKQEQLITIREYMEYRIALFKKEKRTGYAGMNVYTLSKILDILGDITLQSFTPATIDKFIRGMNKLSNATQHMRLSHLKSCINAAIREGIVKYDTHPFAYSKMPRSAIKQLDITIEEFQKILTLKTKHKRIGLAKDLFLLSFYCGGMNLADIVQADFSGNTVKFIRKKTSNHNQDDRIITLFLTDEAKTIIKKYIKRNGTLDFGYKFTYSNFQCYLNYCLKRLAKEVGIGTKSFTFYSARKTFSQFAAEIGIPDNVIDYCLGHSNQSKGVIRYYTRISQKKAEIAIKRVIEYTKNPDDFKACIEMRTDAMILKL